LVLHFFGAAVDAVAGELGVTVGAVGTARMGTSVVGEVTIGAGGALLVAEPSVADGSVDRVALVRTDG